MPGHPIRHTHAGGFYHSHVTTLAPATVELLQRLDDFATALSPDAETALRGLLKAGLLARVDKWHRIEAARDGYQHGWYGSYIASHHEHITAVIDGETFSYLPPWWPVGTGFHG